LSAVVLHPIFVLCVISSFGDRPLNCRLIWNYYFQKFYLFVSLRHMFNTTGLSECTQGYQIAQTNTLQGCCYFLCDTHRQ